MKSLFVISQEAVDLASQLEEGEFTPQLELALVINQNELQEKSLNYGYVIKTLEYDVAAIDEEIKRLRAIKTSKETVIDRMKDSVLNAMKIYGIEKVTSPTLTISTRRSESVEVPDINLLHEAWTSEKVLITPNKILIKNAIGNGVTVAGAYIKENYSLQIK